MNAATRTLVFGWGNPGRLDDGLGPAFAQQLEAIGLDGVRVETDYQLQVEHAADLALCDRVLFVDADRTCPEPFDLRRLDPTPDALRYTSHEMSPAAVLALCEELSGSRPEAWLLGVRGYEFDEFGEELSERAGANLEKAVSFVHESLRTGGLEPSAGTGREPAVTRDRVGES